MKGVTSFASTLVAIQPMKVSPALPVVVTIAVLRGVTAGNSSYPRAIRWAELDLFPISCNRHSLLNN